MRGDFSFHFPPFFFFFLSSFYRLSSAYSCLSSCFLLNNIYRSSGGKGSPLSLFDPLIDLPSSHLFIPSSYSGKGGTEGAAMASVLEEYLRYRQMAKSDEPPSIFISSMVGPVKSKYLQPCLLTVDEVSLVSIHLSPAFVYSFRCRIFCRLKLFYLQVGSSINHFEFLPQRDSIAVLLYHRQKRQFLLVRRFRPGTWGVGDTYLVLISSFSLLEELRNLYFDIQL